VIDVIAISRGRGSDLVAGIGAHQRQERAEGLAGEHHAAIALLFELMHVLHERLGALGERVVRAPAIEAEGVPPAAPQLGDERRRRRFEIFRIGGAPVAPDHRPNGIDRAERRARRIGGRNPTLRVAKLRRDEFDHGDETDDSEFAKNDQVRLHRPLHRPAGELPSAFMVSAATAPRRLLVTGLGTR
jgi:hypothetical protein